MVISQSLSTMDIPVGDQQRFPTKLILTSLPQPRWDCLLRKVVGIAQLRLQLLSTPRHPRLPPEKMFVVYIWRSKYLFSRYSGRLGSIWGFLKWWYPQNTPKWSFLVENPMIVGYHHFGKPPHHWSISEILTRNMAIPIQSDQLKRIQAARRVAAYSPKRPESGICDVLWLNTDYDFD